MLQRGGLPVDAFTANVSKDIVQILQALVILCVSADGLWTWLKPRRAAMAESTVEWRGSRAGCTPNS